METLVLIFVAWNAILQTFWFFWSYSVHKRKHYTDQEEIERMDNLIEYVDQKVEEVKDTKSWEEFRGTPEMNKSYKKQNGKYHPDDIPGMFDGVFND